MKVLLIGGTGTLSSDTTSLCIERGFEVYLLNRGRNKIFSEDVVHYLIGDVNDLESAKAAIGDQTFDVVIDYITYNVMTLKKRIELFGRNTKQYIFISSATVFKPSKFEVNEKTDIGNDDWEYSRNKLLCERYLYENRNDFLFAYTIVRPYVTYDKKRIPFPIISKKSCWNLLDRVQNGKPILMCGDGNQKVTLTSTKDFAVGIVGLLGNEAAYYQDFNIVGDYRYTWNDVIRELEQYTGKLANVVFIPTEAVSKKIPSLSSEILCDKGFSHLFDNKKIKTVVPEFISTVSLHEGLLMTFDYLSNTPEIQVVDLQWNAMENVLCKSLGNKSIKVSFQDRWLYFTHENREILRLKRILKNFL